jgi:hypothetical protein
MGKKKKGEEPMHAPSPAKNPPTQVKIAFDTNEELEEVRAIAKSTGRSLTAFVMVAVREKVRRVKEGKNG